jgi:hypothetical protein
MRQGDSKVTVEALPPMCQLTPSTTSGHTHASFNLFSAAHADPSFGERQPFHSPRTQSPKTARLKSSRLFPPSPTIEPKIQILVILYSYPNFDTAVPLGAVPGLPDTQYCRYNAE